MEESSNQPPISQFNYSSTQPQKKSKKFFYMILFAILLVLAIWATTNFFGTKDQKEIPVITPTPTEYQFPTDTPTPSVNPTGEEEKPTTAPTTKAVNPIDSATGLDRSLLSVEVQNGSGETGVASKGSDVLKGFGYKVVATGNADNFDYQNTTIKVKSAKSNYLALLKKDLGFSYTVGSASADLDSSSTADALVILGK
ncbi:MAG: LytR C-terminal domain-containing protein [bacterium]|nr:LytR C-terminal domain-containing protein [bacterium]